MDEGTANPFVRQNLLQIHPGLIQLVPVVAAGVLPIPHPLGSSAVEGAHGHPEIDARARTLEPWRPHVFWNGPARRHAPGLWRGPSQEAVDHASANVAHRRRPA